MSEVEVKNMQNEKCGVLSLNADLFGVQVSIPLLHEAVTMQLASVRQGTAATKTRGLVSGGGKKPWKQKGTGRARAGSSRSPLWRGGGTIFGPQPRGYGYSLTKQKSRIALSMALSSKAKEGRLVVLEDLQFPSNKTKDAAKVLATLRLTGRILMVVASGGKALARVVGNIPEVYVIESARMSVYDLIRSEWLVTTKQDMAALGWGIYGSA